MSSVWSALISGLSGSIVRRKDEEKYGEYRTKRMVLEAYGRLEPLKH
jgi:hypothetical protein